ncbi:MAG: Jag N-terminal domain-containing protein [Anaerolineae bacterium]|nr:Jag N-terminal domain-containing protein [Anaerolineae bacterium]HRX01817.1 RNA-binding cell elongation regulator Jag/EloR [Anaerolineae bacterium]
MTSSEGNEFRGRTPEEATETGLAILKLTEEQVEIEVLSKGSRGLLGFGAEDARVRITPIGKKTSKPASPPPPEKTAAPPPRPTVKTQPEATVQQPEAPKAPPKPEKPVEPKPSAAPGDGADPKDVAAELLQGLLDRMGVKASVQTTEYRGVLDEGQDAPLVLNIEGEDLGILIGRRAETLSSIQYLTRLMVNHRLHRWVNVIVDVEGYRARREEQLARLANRMADRAVSTGKPVMLEAMPPNERRIVHITLRDNPLVTTESVGEGDHRKVTIIPKE